MEEITYENIEELGWFKHSWIIPPFFIKYKDNYTYGLGIKDNIIRIERWIQGANCSVTDQVVLFKGVINNKEELKFILNSVMQ